MYTILLAIYQPFLSRWWKRTFRLQSPPYHFLNHRPTTLSSALFGSPSIALLHHMMAFGTLHYFNQTHMPFYLLSDSHHPLTHCILLIRLDSRLLPLQQPHHLFVTHPHCSQTRITIIRLQVILSLLPMIQWTRQIMCRCLLLQNKINHPNPFLPTPIHLQNSTNQIPSEWR